MLDRSRGELLPLKANASFSKRKFVQEKFQMPWEETVQLTDLGDLPPSVCECQLKVDQGLLVGKVMEMQAQIGDEPKNALQKIIVSNS